MTLDARVRSAIAAGAARVWPELVTLRRQIHRHPELAGSERQTARLVAARLAAAGLEVRESVGGHGVVALLRGAAATPVVAYRADMDAVAGAETFAAGYASEVDGAAHLCGHDVHTAVGIGVAEVLSSMRSSLPGSALFLFQPAEEPLLGARAMIEDGALGGSEPSAFFAVHAFPLPVGTLAITPGSGFASRDHVEIRVPVEAPAEAVQAIESVLLGIGHFEYPSTDAGIETLMRGLVSGQGFDRFHHVERWPDSHEPGALVLNFGVRAAGYSTDDARRRVEEAVAVLDPAVVRSLRFPSDAVPAMRSDVGLSRHAARVVHEVLGPESVGEVRGSVPFNSEDFSLFGELAPAAMLLLGVANRDLGIRGVPHEPDFSVDEGAMRVGVHAMASVIWDAAAQLAAGEREELRRGSDDVAGGWRRSVPLA